MCVDVLFLMGDHSTSGSSLLFEDIDIGDVGILRFIVQGHNDILKETRVTEENR